MPELPEVETVCRGLRVALQHAPKIKTVDIRRPNLRIPFPVDLAERLTGQFIEKIDRRAKYMRLYLSNQDCLLIHLGMSGRVLIHTTPQPRLKHDHLVLQFDDDTQVVLNDARRFGMVDICAVAHLDKHAFFSHLGVEPLSNHFNAHYLYEAIQGRKTPIKQMLMDQRVVVGVGNIYAAEALYKARIDPRKPANTLNVDDCEQLVRAVRTVLDTAIAAGGSSLRDYVQSSGELGYFQHQWAVYNKAGQKCPDCTCDINETGGIEKITQGGRSTFYCPRKQS